MEYDLTLLTGGRNYYIDWILCKRSKAWSACAPQCFKNAPFWAILGPLKWVIPGKLLVYIWGADSNRPTVCPHGLCIVPIGIEGDFGYNLRYFWEHCIVHVRVGVSKKPQSLFTWFVHCLSWKRRLFQLSIIWDISGNTALDWNKVDQKKCRLECGRLE